MTVQLDLERHGTALVLAQIAEERLLQVTKWGEQSLPDLVDTQSVPVRGIYLGLSEWWKKRNDHTDEPDWRGVLLEEVYEALAEADPVDLRAELIQVAAVATAWIEDIDRKRLARAHELLLPQMAVIGERTLHRYECGTCDWDTEWLPAKRAAQMASKHQEETE